MDEEDVYTQLRTIFADRGDNVLTFEALSFAPMPLQVDDEAIGVTKKALMKAFLKARSAFFDFIRDHRDAGAEMYPETVLTDTSIILLYDTEFLTAANWRKKWLLHQLQNKDDESAANAICRELSFTASLLSSPMHRTAKSPMLWYHRLWILQMLFKKEGQASKMLKSIAARTLDVKWKFQTSMVTHDAHIRQTTAVHDESRIEHLLRVWGYETLLAQCAGENHPHNYYAWKHLRHLFHSTGPCITLSGVRANKIAADDLLAQAILAQTQRWCLQHPRDISGWSFFQFLLHHVRETSLREKCVNDTVDYARKIGWKGEGLWRFVDTMNDQLANEGRDDSYTTTVTDQQNENGSVVANFAAPETTLLACGPLATPLIQRCACLEAFVRGPDFLCVASTVKLAESMRKLETPFTEHLEHMFITAIPGIDGSELHPRTHGKMYSKWAKILKEIKSFMSIDFLSQDARKELAKVKQKMPNEGVNELFSRMLPLLQDAELSDRYLAAMHSPLARSFPAYPAATAEQTLSPQRDAVTAFRTRAASAVNLAIDEGDEGIFRHELVKEW
ncbi:hypothetical protein KEM56_006692 [Ascosphaera pollenicola]|nr:hypothetical protein KEM56_006692 [Ascosphaera pollenicola]